MKKLLCALLALAMLCACAVAETVDVTGTWYLAEVCWNGESVNASQIGLEETLTLQPDGTVEMDAQWGIMEKIWDAEGVQEPDPAEVHWKMDGNKIILIYENNETRELTLVDGNLVESQEDSDTPDVYSREKPIVNHFDPGVPLTDVTLEDFDGTWNATVFNLAVVEVTAEDMTLEITIELSGGSGIITYSSANLRKPQTYTVTGELTDGVLTVTEVEPETDEAASMTFTLYDSGVMAQSDNLFVIYFERAEASAEE